MNDNRNDDRRDQDQQRGSERESGAHSDNRPQQTSESSADHAAPHRFGDFVDHAIPADATAEAKAEAEKFKNEYLYLRAEFDNYKKHVIKERSDLRKYGSERLVVDLLGVLDIFETALATPVSLENLQNFLKGIEMTATELRLAMQRHGVEELAAQGQLFDPTVHEALSSEESDEVPAGTITRVFKKPYKLHDRVVRPGQVVVAKSKG